MARMSDLQSRRQSLTTGRLRELVSYDASTGVFVRLSNTTRQKAGDAAGSRRADGYVKFRVDGVEHFAHRLAWLYVHGEWPEKHIDHIDGNPTNNALINLRLADDGENLQNQWRASSKSRTGLLGVSFHKCGYWRARIAVNKKSRTVGYFKTAELAHQAYLEAKRELHPFGQVARVCHV